MSNELQSRLETLAELEQTYRPNVDIAQQLGEKSLIMLVAPAGVGKSTIMNEIVSLDERFARISGFTTRNQRADDEPGLYRYVEHDAQNLNMLIRRARSGDIVQFALHPTTGFVYGTDIQDYPGEYNCKDVLSHGVAGFRSLPVKQTYTYSLVCEPEQWLARLAARKEQTDDEMQKRLDEAKVNLRWSLTDPDTVFVRNNDGELGQAVRDIITHTTGEQSVDGEAQTRLRDMAAAMYRAATAR